MVRRSYQDKTLVASHSKESARQAAALTQDRLDTPNLELELVVVVVAVVLASWATAAASNLVRMEEVGLDIAHPIVVKTWRFYSISF